MAKFDKFLGKIVERVVGGVIDPAWSRTLRPRPKALSRLRRGAEVTAGTDTAKAVVPSTLKTELDKKVDKVAGKGFPPTTTPRMKKNKVAAALTSVPDASTSTKGHYPDCDGGGSHRRNGHGQGGRPLHLENGTGQEGRQGGRQRAFHQRTTPRMKKTRSRRR